jgi:hypothetical protein
MQTALRVRVMATGMYWRMRSATEGNSRRRQAVMQTERGYQVRCSVAPSSPRTAAQQLGSRWAISAETNDLFVENGQITRVSGLASLPQAVTSCFSMLRGESPFSSRLWDPARRIL